MSNLMSGGGKKVAANVRQLTDSDGESFPDRHLMQQA